MVFPDLLCQDSILPRAKRWLTAYPRIVATGGDIQHTAHHGNREHGPILSYELEDFGGTESVSRANQAAAFFRISRSTRNWRFSRRRLSSSSRSDDVRPSCRRPSSRSAWATQLRIVWAEGSNSRASFSGLLPARTISTIWLRNSCAYGGLDLGIVNSSSKKDKVSTKPGQLQSTRRSISGMGLPLPRIRPSPPPVYTTGRSSPWGKTPTWRRLTPKSFPALT